MSSPLLELTSQRIEWIRTQAIDDGQEELTIGRAEDRYVIRFPDLATFVINPKDQAVEWHWRECDPPLTHRSATRLTQNQVLPMLVATQGALVLHASAVLLDDGTVIGLSGPSGIGKSTLSRAFPKTASSTVLADDWIVIDPIAPRPMVHAYQNLNTVPLPRASQRKNRQRSGPYSLYTLPEIKAAQSVAHPLKAIYLLEPELGIDEIAITTPKRRTQFRKVAENLFRLDTTDSGQLKQELFAVTSLLESSPVRTIRYPRRRDALAAVVRAIQADI